MLMKIISQDKFESIKDCHHRDCNMDSETIDDNTQRIICYDHNDDWFVNIKLPQDIKNQS